MTALKNLTKDQLIEKLQADEEKNKCEEKESV